MTKDRFQPSNLFPFPQPHSLKPPTRRHAPLGCAAPPAAPCILRMLGHTIRRLCPSLRHLGARVTSEWIGCSKVITEVLSAGAASPASAQGVDFSAVTSRTMRLWVFRRSLLRWKWNDCAGTSLRESLSVRRRSLRSDRQRTVAFESQDDGVLAKILVPREDQRSLWGSHLRDC